MSIKRRLAIALLLLATPALATNKKVMKLNRITIGMGAGPAGLKVSKDSKYVVQRAGIVGGVYYQRKLNNNVVVGLGAETNKTVILQVGKDF